MLCLYKKFLDEWVPYEKLLINNFGKDKKSSFFWVSYEFLFSENSEFVFNHTILLFFTFIKCIISKISIILVIRIKRPSL